MESLRINKNKSIGRRFIGIFVLITFIMLLGFYISFSLESKMSEKYNETIYTNTQLSKLSIEINRSTNFFNKYMRDKDEEYYNQYFSSTASVTTILERIKGDIAKDVNSSIYHRNLSNMFDYYKSLSEEIISQDTLNVSTYKKMIEIRTLATFMNSHSQLLIKSYLDYSSEEYSSLLTEYSGLQYNIFIIAVIFGALSIIFSLYLSNNIFKTIDNLSETARELSSGNWNIPDVKEGKYYELNNLARAFNNMKTSIKTFIEELKNKSELEIKLKNERLRSMEKDKLLKESQLLALQMQMEPHFLFNTLNTIARISMFEGADTTVKLIESISRILRYNLNNKGELVPLQNEVNVLKSYITIQETRFRDQMSFDFKIENGLDDVLIPPMTIQPIVENAIIHGLGDVYKDGKIDISISRINEYVEIDVKDNGKGIDCETINNILSGKRNPNTRRDTTGLGILNVKKRLELHFNKEDLLRIESSIDIGTTVKLFVPFSQRSDKVD